MGFTPHLFGQTIEIISVEKVNDYIQTDTGTTSPRPLVPSNQSYPFTFRIDVEGTGLGSLDAPTFTTPAAGSYDDTTDPNLGVLIYDAGDGEWGRTFTFGAKYTATGGAPGGSGIWGAGPGGTGTGGMDGWFNNGAYTVTVNGETVNLQLGGDGNVDVYPNTPIATLSAGTWAGGGLNRLYLNPNEALTINTGTFTNFGTAGYVSGINLFIGQNGTDVVDMLSLSSNLLNDAGWINTDSLEHTFGAGSLVAGTEYYVEIEFFNLTTVQNISELDGALALAIFSSRTQFSISVVPEPSTYAVICGALALAGVVVVRRRKV